MILDTMIYFLTDLHLIFILKLILVQITPNLIYNIVIPSYIIILECFQLIVWYPCQSLFVDNTNLYYKADAEGIIKKIIMIITMMTTFIIEIMMVIKIYDVQRSALDRHLWQ